MKRIKLLFCFLLALAASNAWGDVSLPANSKIYVKGKAAKMVAVDNESDNSHWYLVTQTREYEFAMFDPGVGNQIRRSTGTTKSATAGTYVNNLHGTIADNNRKFLVHFIKTKQTDYYKVQFATGNYASNADGDPVKSSSTGSDYYIANFNGLDGYFAWRYGDKGVDNNNYTVQNTLSLWNTATEINKNQDWHFYEVDLLTDTEIANIEKPQVAHYYVIESAYSGFTNQDKHKCIYADGTAVKWGTYDATKLNYILKAENVDGNKVQFRFMQNSVGQYYFGFSLSSSGTITTQKDANTIELTYNNNGCFGLKSTGSNAALHPGSWSGDGGSIVNWGSLNVDQSQWVIKDITDRITLQNLVNEANNLQTTVGTELGNYPSQDIINQYLAPINTAKLNANTIISKNYKSVEEAVMNYKSASAKLRTALNDLYAQANMPKKDTYYVFESAYAEFISRTKQMCIYATDGALRWKAYSSSDLSFYFKVEKVEGNQIMFKTYYYNTYPKPGIYESSAVTTQTVVNTMNIVPIGNGRFALQADGCSWYINPSGHSTGVGTEGPIVSWGGSTSASNEWYIKEMPKPASASIKFGTNVDDIPQWYAMDIRAKHGTDTHNYPLYGDESTIKTGEDPDDFRSGAVKNENYIWGFIGTPGECKIYNKGLKAYAIKVENGNKQDVTLGGTGSDFQFFEGNAEIESSFAIKKVDDQDTQYSGYYWNEQSGAIKSWHSIDQGSSIRIFPVTLTDTSITYNMGAEYGTLIVPFYSEIPEGFHFYTCSDVGGSSRTTLQLSERTMIKPDTAYIISGTKGTNFTLSNTSKLKNPKEGAKMGLLVGTYNGINAEGVTTLAGDTEHDNYVLRIQSGKLGFYKLEGSYTSLTIGKNRCYLQKEKEKTSSSDIKAFFFDDETGINNVDVDANDDDDDDVDSVIYNLSGQRMNKLQKGINIVNGRKVLY